MNPVLTLDTQLFLLLNNGVPRSIIFDTVFIMLSGVDTGGFVWIVAGFLLFIREEEKYHLFFVPLGIAIGASYAVTELFIKPLIARPRPSLHMGALVLTEELHTYSFPSSHAAMAFAGATILSYFEPRYRRLWFLLAVGIGFSRIYLGKHYPFDVFVGACIGWCMAMLSLGIYQQIKRMYPARKNDKQKWHG